MGNSTCLCKQTDLSYIPGNKGSNSRLGWTIYSNLYEVVHPNFNLIFLYVSSLELNARKVHYVSFEVPKSIKK